MVLGPLMSGRVVESLRGVGRAKARMLSWALMMRVNNNMLERRGMVKLVKVIQMGGFCKKIMCTRKYLVSKGVLIDQWLVS